MTRELIVDLHVHSRYSRATSKDCSLAGLYRWGKIKGIHIIGTGDFTHPHWFKELRDQLVYDKQSGFYLLKPALAEETDAELPAKVRDEPIWFVPSVEISTIYSKLDQVRKIHQLLVLPDLQTVSELRDQLMRIGNLSSDGRPILGMDSKKLLARMLEVSDQGLYIPAHIWTPWFSVFGSRSGFDSLEAAYEELTPHVRAIETGLSSDPSMNWRLSQLDKLAITSNSDAHSPQKLGREATILHCEPSYQEMMQAIRTNDDRLIGTIEFFPEEGKYHYDGHRVCGVRFSPAETKAHKGICPKCGRLLTVGVDYRVDELADRPVGYQPAAPKRVEYIIPLTEILGELAGKGPSSKAVEDHYWRLIGSLGSEFAILRQLPIEQIQQFDQPVAQAIERLRSGKVVRDPGYDGVFGTIKVAIDSDHPTAESQISLL